MTRIMVVDDEILICQLLTYQLNGAGYMVSTAQSGREALQRLLIEQPDLLILDVMMQDMSGWDLCRQIRSYSSVPIILLTARGADDDVVTGLNAGADDYITKPFRLAQLLARIEAVLRRNNLHEQTVADMAALPVTSGATLVAQHKPRQPNPLPLYSQQRQAATQTMARPLTPIAAKASPILRTETADAAQRQKADPWAAQMRIGQSFSIARKQRGLTLHEAERLCGVRWEFLQAIEQEHFGYMPRAQLRHALKAYSTLLNLDLAKLIGHEPTPRPRWWISVVIFATCATIMVILLVITSLQFL